MEVGDLHTIPISHGEGRFVCSDSLLEQLAANGQIATQYVDFLYIFSYNKQLLQEIFYASCKDFLVFFPDDI